MLSFQYIWSQLKNSVELLRLGGHLHWHLKLLLVALGDEIGTHILDLLRWVHNVHHQRLHFTALGLFIDILHQMASTLDSTEGDLANLLWIEVFPWLVVHVLEEGHDVDGVNEVDESVADIAAIVQIERQVEEVICTLVESIDTLQEHLFCVLVWNMTDHNCRASVLTAQ